MSFSDLRSAIEGRFQAQWGTTTPIKWRNVEFNQPTSGTWVAFFVLDGEGNQVSMEGNSLHRFAGVVVLQIFVPEKTGTDAARSLADTAAAIWRSSSTNQGLQIAAGNGLVTFRPSSLSDEGVNDGWQQLNLTTPFRFDERFG